MHIVFDSTMLLLNYCVKSCHHTCVLQTCMRLMIIFHFVYEDHNKMKVHLFISRYSLQFIYRTSSVIPWIWCIYIVNDVDGVLHL